MVGQENTSKRVAKRAKRNGFLIRPAVPANSGRAASGRGMAADVGLWFKRVASQVVLVG